MIVGKVNGELEAIVELSVQDAQGEFHSFTCVLDSGFDGYLALPVQEIQSLGLVHREARRTLLVDSLEIFLPLYRGTAYWCGSFLEVTILGTEQEYLVGMALLEDSTLTVQVWDGGDVLVEPR